MSKHIKKAAKKKFVSIGILPVVFITCLGILLLVADMVFEQKNLTFDENVFKAIQPYYKDGRIHFFEVITFLGSTNFLLAANTILVIAFAFSKKYRNYSWKIAIVAITGVSCMFGLKELLKRERPLNPLTGDAYGYSFPSGHSFSSLLFFGVLAYIVFKMVKNIFWRWLIIILMLLLVLLIGFSRIYLHVHYASDVIAGFMLAAIWLIIAKWTFVDRVKYFPKKPTQVV